MKRFDLIVSNMNYANKKNNTLFRRICKESFKKSYSELEIQNNLDVGAKMLGVGIISAIKMARGRHKKDSFAKSIKKLNHQTNVLTYSDLEKINYFLEISEFAFVIKLLKTQYNYDLNASVAFITSH